MPKKSANSHSSGRTSASSVSSTGGTAGSLSSGMGRMNLSSRSSSSGYGQSSSGQSSDYATPRDSRVTSAISHHPTDKPNDMGPKEDRPYKQQCIIARPTEKYQNVATVTFSLQANFYKVQLNAQLQVYHYDIQIYKSPGGKDPMRKIDDTNPIFWDAHSRDQESRNPMFPLRDKIIFNGVNSLYCIEQVALPRGKGSFDFRAETDGKRYNVRVMYTGMKSVTPFPNTAEEKTTLQTFIDMVCFGRILCTQIPDSKDFYKYGPSIFYRPTETNLRRAMEQNLTISLGKGLEAWTGFFGAVKVNLEYGTLMNIDLKHSGFYMQDRNLVEFYIEMMINTTFEKAMTENQQSVLATLRQSAMNVNQRQHLEKILARQRLTYRRPTGTEKIFKFSKLSNVSAVDYNFRLEDGQRTTIAKYFAETMKHPLKYPYLPLVSLDAKGKNWAPMELIYTSKMPYRYQGQIPEFQRALMVRQTAFPPRDRQRMITDMVEAKDGRPRFLAEQDERMTAYGVKFENKPVRVKASLMPAPTLKFGDDLILRDKENTGIWTMQNGEKELKKIVTEKVSLVPMLVHITPGSKKNPSRQFDVSCSPCSTILRVLTKLGFNLPLGDKPMQKGPIQWDPEGVSMAQLEVNLTNFKNDVQQAFPGAIPIIFFVIPYKCTTYGVYSEYTKVKWLCDVKIGLHCQFILLSVYNQCGGNPMTASTAHNIALKVAAKIGAIHHTVDPSTNESWKLMRSKEHPTLVLGIDVTHPGTMDREKDTWQRLSVASIVGNIDLEISKFASSHRIQDYSEEMTVNLQAEFVERITDFYTRTGVRPEHLVVYRDGIAENMFQKVLFEEKNALVAACQQIEASYKPTITYLVMTKRHRTKFFALKPEDACAPLYNLKPGTLVESGVTSSIYYDFYLYSHPGTIGTSRPAHYYVLWDDWQPSAVFWQEITFALTYGYQRCLKSISQASPVMYAHLAAKRAKDYLDGYFKSGGKQGEPNDYAYYMQCKKQLTMNAGLQGMLFV